MGHGLIRLAYDIGPGVGLGHRARMSALHAALAQLGHDAELGALDGDIVEGDVVVIDSYRVRADNGHVRARRTVAVDDLDRALAVDLLVDPAPSSAADPATPPEVRRLRGLQYALVDPSLRGRAPTQARGAAVRRVLVTTGGTDASGVGARVAGSVARALPHAQVRMVVGPWSDAAPPRGVVVLRAPDRLVDELGGADLVVTASGVTLLEALTLGRPTIALLTAENQRRYFEGVVRSGAAVGATDATVGDLATDLAANADRRQALSEAAMQAVDGRGALRVAEAVVALR